MDRKTEVNIRVNKKISRPFLRLLLVCVCIQSAAIGGTIVLTPGNTLRIDFTSNPTLTPCPGACDFLSLFLVLSAPSSPGELSTANLFNGGTLLGSFGGNPVAGLNFRSVTSLDTSGTTIDFAALQVPFVGSFFVTSSLGLSIDTDLTNVDLGHGTGPAGFTYFPATTQISSITLVPEPRYAGLLGVLLGILAVGKVASSRRSRRCA